MADMHMTGPARGEASSGRLASAANWLGAALSLALVVGISVWGYRVIMRDVSGVPVVQAIDGPMRVAPDNPGGQIARHEGLAVNDIASIGTAAPPPETIILAPRPLDVTDEDVAIAELALEEDLNPREVVALAALREDALASVAPLALADIANADDPIRALADQIAANATPFSEIAPVSASVPEADRAAVDAAVDAVQVASIGNLIPSSVPGVAQSLRPAPRPVGLQVASLAATVPTVSAAASERNPDDIPAGTRLVQFGAFDSPEIAREQWARLEARFSEYLAGKERVIEEATSGGRVFYRLRAYGFADLSDSRRFCSAIVAQGADCIPVVSR